MRIMITGGYDESAAENDDGRVLVEFAKALAEQVVVQKHQLRCGNLSSLDRVVIEAACDTAERDGLDPEKVVRSYHLKGRLPRTSRGGVSESAIERWSSIDGRRLSIPEPLEQADVVILVGGFGDGSGTFTAANWARQTGKPILPVATFGMAAADIFHDLPDTVERTRITGLGKDDLHLLTKSQAVLKSPDAVTHYAASVVSLAEKAALSRDVFLIMSFAKSDALEDYHAAVSAVCTSVGFEAIRTDTRSASSAHQIIDSVHSQIKSCGFVIADLTDERPNVYYEIGYAMGLGKKLILTSRSDAVVHFDLQGYERIQWTGSENLKKQLKPLVEAFALDFGLNPRGNRRTDGPIE